MNQNAIPIFSSGLTYKTVNSWFQVWTISFIFTNHMIRKNVCTGCLNNKSHFLRNVSLAWVDENAQILFFWVPHACTFMRESIFYKMYLWPQWMKMFKFFFSEFPRLVKLWGSQFLYHNPAASTIALHQSCILKLRNITSSLVSFD